MAGREHKEIPGASKQVEGGAKREGCLMDSAAALVAFLLIADTLSQALLLPLAHRFGRRM